MRPAVERLHNRVWIGFNRSAGLANATLAFIANGYVGGASMPVLGIQQYNRLEITTTAVGDLFTYLGTEQNMALSALWRA